MGKDTTQGRATFSKQTNNFIFLVFINKLRSNAILYLISSIFIVCFIFFLSFLSSTSCFVHPLCLYLHLFCICICGCICICSCICSCICVFSSSTHRGLQVAFNSQPFQRGASVSREKWVNFRI